MGRPKKVKAPAKGGQPMSVWLTDEEVELVKSLMELHHTLKDMLMG